MFRSLRTSYFKGYLGRGIRQNSADAAAARKLRVVYGSQTGTATMLAQLLAKAAKKKQWTTEVVNAAKLPQLEPSSSPHIFVVSCFGQGEPTDSTKALHAWLGGQVEEGKKTLDGLPVAVFGLGSSEYAGHRYQRVGKDFDSRLEALGAKALIQRGEGDSAADLEGDFEDWQNNLLKILDEIGGAKKEEVKAAPVEEEKIRFYSDSSPPPPEKGYYKEVNRTKHNFNHPYMAKVDKTRQLHHHSSPRSAHHIEFELPPGMTYVAGDYLAVFPSNSDALVSSLAKSLGVLPQTKFSLVGSQIALMLEKVPPWFPNPCTVHEALAKFCDLTAPPQRHFLRFLAEKAGPADKEELLRLANLPAESRQEFIDSLHFKTLPEILQQFPSVRLTFQDVLEMTQPLKFRYYSISSSPSLTPNRVSITVVRNAFSHPKKDKLMFGTSSGYLDSLNEGDEVPIFVQESPFRLPSSDVPIIMVGAGTGLAPMRGFILERMTRGILGKRNGIPLNILFFGCMRRTQDYIYGEDLEQWSKDGVIDYHTAFSHETPQLVFVQHRLKEQADLVFNALEAGAHFYVCGSLQMGAGVEEALKEIIAAKKGPDAAAYLAALNDADRLHWDLFA